MYFIQTDSVRIDDANQTYLLDSMSQTSAVPADHSAEVTHPRRDQSDHLMVMRIH